MTIYGWHKNARTKRKLSAVFPVSFPLFEQRTIPDRANVRLSNKKKFKNEWNIKWTSFSRYIYLFHGICIILHKYFYPSPYFFSYTWIACRQDSFHRIYFYFIFSFFYSSLLRSYFILLLTREQNFLAWFYLFNPNMGEEILKNIIILL